MADTPISVNKSERVSAVLVRAAALSDELRSTIEELQQILRREDETDGDG